MKNIFLITIAVFVAIASLASCGNSNASKAKEERKIFVRDSIARAEFVRDSIARAEFVRDSIARVEHNAKIIEECKNLYNVQKDEFSNTNTAWVKPKNAPTYRNRNGIYCYFAIENEKATSNFRFVYQYYAEDWLFIRNMVFNIDGENITIVPNMKTDCAGGKIWEWCDEFVRYNTGTINEEFIRKIANATSVKVKMNGLHYYNTRTLSATQIKSIKDTYNYFLALDGKFVD